MKTPNKILIDGPAWIGDMVMAQVLFKLLRRQYPDAQLAVLAPRWTNPLLQRMPEVQCAIDLPFSHGVLNLKQRVATASALRAEGYDWAILLRNSFKSALIPWLARIPKRTGWLGEWRYGVLNDWRKLDQKRYPLMIERFMALAFAPHASLPNPYPRPSLVVEQNQVDAALARHQLSLSPAPILAICPGAEYGPAKRWPCEYYAEVANAKLQEGWQVWIFGSQKDQVLAAKINILCDFRCIELTGKTSLCEAIDLLSLVNVVVANDSGLMHVAAALDVPLVALYGSSTPTFTPPLARRVQTLSLQRSCSPCFERECPLNHYKCLYELHPDLVLQALDAVLQEPVIEGETTVKLPSKNIPDLIDR